MATHNERKLLKTVYGPAWAKKVDKMSDSQVIAVLARLRAKNIIRK